MTHLLDDTSLSKPATDAGLLDTIAVILRWIWLVIKGVNNPQIKRSETFWDMLAYDYDKKTRKFEQMFITTVEYAKKYLTASDIVLDYGCGTGIEAIELADTVNTIHGIDISSNMVETAKRKAAERKIGNIDFAQTTLFDEGYTRESFDVILVFNVLHFLEDTQKVMNRIHELVKPGGLMISVTPCSGEKKSFLNMLFSRFMKTGIFPYVRFFTFSELEDSITQGNFHIIENKKLHTTEEHYFIVAKKRENM